MVEKFYDSFIYDGRYKYIFEGLFNTLVIALFAWFNRCFYRNFYSNNKT